MVMDKPGTRPPATNLPIRTRLLLGTILWISVALALTGVVLSVLFKNHVQRQFENELNLHLTQLIASVEVEANGNVKLDHQPADPRFSQPFSGLYWQINRPGEHDVMRSRSLWDASLSIGPHDAMESTTRATNMQGPQGQHLLVLSRQVSTSEAPDKPFTVTIAANTQGMEQAVKDWVYLLVIFLGILFMTLVLAAIAQVALGLRPLRNLEHAIHQLANGKKNRLEGVFPKEVEPLIDAFNQVLAQNDSMIERAQHRAGDFAHSMKTPLTVLANAAALHTGKDTADIELARIVNEQVSILRGQVNQQLQQARADAISVQRNVHTDVAPVIHQLVNTLKKIYADKHLHFVLNVPEGEIRFRGDAGAIQEMLGNLLDNACKWAHSKVQVSCFTHGTSILILIEDDGAGVPYPDLDKIIQRGVRADERTPGSGLGLSIVSELALLHGGELKLGKSVLGGLSAALLFPGG